MLSRAGIATLACAALVSVLACSSRAPCVACEGSPPEYRLELSSQELTRRVARCFERAPEPPAALLLSGGGSRGAWGAGFLKGWSGAGRPDFHLVTGISTGALQATFAFLGSDYDPVLESAYTETTNADVFKRRFPFTILFADSVLSTAPLRASVKRTITDAVIDAVGAEFRERGRLLLVGSVDLDRGSFRVWDLSTLAASERPERYERYRDIVVASAAIPVVFEPVEIDGALHVDGGVRQQIFAEAIAREIAQGRRGPAGAEAPRPAAYAIVNGKLVAERRCVDERLGAIAGRSLELLLAEGLLGNLRSASEILGSGWRFQFSSVPDELCLDLDTAEFDPRKMRNLFRAGQEAGAALAWRDEIPPSTSAPSRCGCPRSD